MTTNDDLRQHIWEFVYELLSHDDSKSLQERITSDPDVARLYAEVKQHSSLVATAAKLPVPPISLSRTNNEKGDQPSSAATSSPYGIRTINALVSLAATLLVGYVGYAYFKSDSPVNPQAVQRTEQQIAQDQLRTIVSGPAKLQPGLRSYFHVSTTSLSGQPREADVAYRLYDAQGELRLERDTRTDESGNLQIELPAVLVTDHARLEVETRLGSNSRTIKTHLQLDQVRQATHLSLDKPLYRPGETVFFRSLTLSRFGLRANREVAVQYVILIPSGAPIEESRQGGFTERGVGNGAFAIPPTFPGGQYTLVASSPLDEFPETRRKFFVRQYRTPRLKKELEFTRDSYTPGGEVVADLSVQRAEGGAATDAKLRITVTVDGQSVVLPKAEGTVSADGTYRVQFHLPEVIEKGAATLSVAVDDGGTQETIAKTIPINLGRVEVRFYPEGGDLVAGLENRVYFHALDPLGEPVHIVGQLIDASEVELSSVETTHEGRGAFRFTPTTNNLYSLKITEPKGITETIPLPIATDDAFLVIDSGAGVFEPGAPIELVLRRHKNVPLVIAAVCRGAQVGQRQILADAPLDGDSLQVSLPLALQAEGVIRLTVYDYSVDPPQPIAERLVYRRPTRKLNIALTDVQQAYRPGEKVKLSLSVTDENGRPAPAVLGVAVVDDALLNLADDKSPSMTTHFHLTTEIEKPEDLEDADFYLSTETDAPQSLDLLLGTEGWRRFVQVSADQLVHGNADAQEQESGQQTEADAALDRLAMMDSTSLPPLVYDDLNQARQSHGAALAAYYDVREADLRQTGQICLLAGAALLVVLTLAALMRLTSGAKVWLPALTAASVSLLVGALWTSHRVDDNGQLTMAPFTIFASENQELASHSHRNDVLRSMMNLGLATGEESLERDALPGNDLYFKNGRFGGDDDSVVEGLAKDRFGLFYEDEKGLGVRPQVRFFDGYLANLEADLRGGKLFDLQVELREKNEGFDYDFGRWVARNNIELAKYRQSQRQRSGRDFDDAFKLAIEAGDINAVLDLAKSVEAQYKQFRFTVRQFAHQHTPGEPGVRSDFAETLYWNPLLLADASGKATVEFDLSDSVTSFRLLANGHHSGRIGVGQGQIVSRIPFSLEPKLPLEVNAGDRIDLPLAVNNDTDSQLPVAISLTHDHLLKLSGQPQRTLTLDKGERGREVFSLDVVGFSGETTVEFKGLAGNLTDGVKRTIQVVPSGFPITQSYAGRIDGQRPLTVRLPENWTPGSLQVSLQAFPSSLADLQKGVDGILREPGGCFEQSSSSNYPNVLALQYMREHDVADPAFTRRAKELLKRGYGQLIGFECPEKGYEWFGGDPGHEALTAYGLMQFRDMSEVWEVDQQMILRTAAWLLNRRDGNGGFTRNPRALDSFGGAPQEITDAYIVWALSESAQQGIDAELSHVIELAGKSEDPYLIALAAASAMNAKSPQGLQLLERLAELQQEDGHLEALNGTITRSGGLSMQVETTALAALAWMKSPAMTDRANRAIQWIVSSRQGGGGFGSTQSTIMALKALIQHSKSNRRTITSGALTLSRDGAEVGRVEFAAGHKQTIVLKDIAGALRAGDNPLVIGLSGDNQMPYVLDIRYRTLKPASDDHCPLRLTTKLSTADVAAGETVSLSVKLANISESGQPMSVAIIGLPAGLEARAEQLEELKKAGKFDFYEMNARLLIFYWRSIGPDAKGANSIAWDLDLIAEIPGRYTGPASRAYLYYTAEEKHWVDPLTVEITKE